MLYKQIDLDCGYLIDILVENQVIFEMETGEELAPNHQAQLLSYFNLSGKEVGLLIIFNV